MKKYAEVEQFYIQRIVDMTRNLSHKAIVWQEVFENGVQLAPETVVHVWTGNRYIECDFQLNTFNYTFFSNKGQVF